MRRDSLDYRLFTAASGVEGSEVAVVSHVRAPHAIDDPFVVGWSNRARGRESWEDDAKCNSRLFESSTGSIDASTQPEVNIPQKSID